MIDANDHRGANHRGAIYKVVDRQQWQTAIESSTDPAGDGSVGGGSADGWTGAAVDLADGYIHFSTGRQLRETVDKHFAGQSDLLLIRVDSARLGPSLRWETSRGGDIFPHLYGPLDPNDVADVRPLDESAIADAEAATDSDAR